MYRLSILAIPFIILTALSKPAGALEGDPAAGQSKMSSCVECHGKDGNSVAEVWPNLAGQHPEYTIKQLKNFKQGENGPRHNPSMYPQAKNLSEQDMADLAAFYATQKVKLSEADADLLEKGQSIYRGGIKDKGIPACIGCHSNKGQGVALARFPKLTGQRAPYIVQQLKAFQEGARRNDLNGMMRDIAKELTESEMEAVANYISGLH